MNSKKEPSVLIINTGGTIGMVRDDPISPLRPGKWDEIVENVPLLGNLPFDTEIETFDPLLDSSDIEYKNWVQMAEVIQENYDKYRGFVILHGTDTMCYTATALSFMLEHLGKPVIITGSQIPLVEPRSDAVQNLVTALYIAEYKSAGLPLIPEVCIFFRDVLIRGNRARKLSSSGYSGFESPNYPVLGTVGEHIKIYIEFIQKPPKEKFFVRKDFMTDVMAIDIFPGMNPEILKNIFVNQPDKNKIRGLVLKTYGAGNAPTNPEFLNAIEEIVNNDVLVADVTQCPQGMVEIGLYEASAQLLDKGVISGLDMTPEAALCKMMWAFGHSEWPFEEVWRQMQLNQRGEQSMNISNVDYGSGDASLVFHNSKMIFGELDFNVLEKATLRFQDAQFVNQDKGHKEISLKVFVDYPSADKNTPTNVAQYAGTIKKTLKEYKKPTNLFYDVTKLVKRFMRPGQFGTISVVAEGGSVRWKKLNLALYTKVE